MSSIDGTAQRQLPEPVQQQASQLCAGQTPIDATAWQVDREGVVHVDIDTSACGLTGNPLYFTSLGGHSRHWLTQGATSIYRSSAQGFRVVVLHPEAHTPETSSGWYINWMARPEGIKSSKLCTGRAEPFTARKPEPDGVRFDIDMRDCGFKESPVLLTSLGGDEGHALTRGATSVYWEDNKGFTVFVQKPGITAEQAEKWGWHINWTAMPEAHTEDFCTGKTVPGATPWQQDGRNALVTSLTTDTCEAPLVFTTVGGRHSHWFALGTSSISRLDGTRFNLKIRRYQATPDWAAREGWHVNWMRATQTVD